MGYADSGEVAWPQQEWAHCPQAVQVIIAPACIFQLCETNLIESFPATSRCSFFCRNKHKAVNAVVPIRFSHKMSKSPKHSPGLIPSRTLLGTEGFH